MFGTGEVLCRSKWMAQDEDLFYCVSKESGQSMKQDECFPQDTWKRSS